MQVFHLECGHLAGGGQSPRTDGQVKVRSRGYWGIGGKRTRGMGLFRYCGLSPIGADFDGRLQRFGMLTLVNTTIGTLFCRFNKYTHIISFGVLLFPNEFTCTVSGFGVRTKRWIDVKNLQS